MTQSRILLAGKNILKSLLLMSLLITAATANTKFTGLTQEYLFSVSAKVRKVIAQDPKTHKKTLEILAKDNNKDVREFALKNLG